MLTYSIDTVKNMSDSEVEFAMVTKLNPGFDQYMSGYRMRDGTRYSSRADMNDRSAFAFFDIESWNDIMQIAEMYDMMPELKRDDGRPLLTITQSIGDTLFPLTIISSFSNNPKRALCEVFLLAEIE
ncbi:MAG: hypothetical protein PF440_11535 [Thiomicrorhabdus sp.]|jgi:hypothetical protein|nr:hypothetical protein [Thiomicrorhabdus sp.]